MINKKTGEILEGHAHGQIKTEQVIVKTRTDNNNPLVPVDEVSDVKVQEELGDDHEIVWTLYAINCGSDEDHTEDGGFKQCDIYTPLGFHRKWFVESYKECWKLVERGDTPPGSPMPLD